MIVSAQFCVSRKGGTEGGEWQGDMHMVAARLGRQSIMVGTRWANSCCMDSPCRGFISGGEGYLSFEQVFDVQKC